MRRLINHGKQFMRFGVVGVANSLLDFSVFFLLHRTLEFGYVSANGGAWLLAVSFSFFGNKFWDNYFFKRKIMFREILKYTSAQNKKSDIHTV